MVDLSRYALLQFAKLPELGRVKTRMQAALSPEQCLSLHKNLMRYNSLQLHSLGFGQYQLWLGSEVGVQSLQSAGPAVELEGAEGGWAFVHSMVEEFGLSLRDQVDGDLGDRMGAAALSELNHFDGVLIIGSDCPFIDEALVNDAVAALAGGADVAIAPAEDGGYTLLAMSRYLPEVFSDMPWSQPHLMQATRIALSTGDRRLDELRKCADIDRPEDLKLLRDLQGLSQYSSMSEL